MKIVIIILGIIVLAFSAYGLLTGNTAVILPFMLLAVGLLFIAAGISEFRKRKVDGLINFVLAAFILVAAVYAFQ